MDLPISIAITYIRFTQDKAEGYNDIYLCFIRFSNCPYLKRLEGGVLRAFINLKGQGQKCVLSKVCGC